MTDRIGDFLFEVLGGLDKKPDPANLDRLRLELNRLQGASSSAPKNEWEFILESTAANTAAIDFTNLGAPYRFYVLAVRNLKPSTDSVSLLVQLSIDNGANFLASAYRYHHQGDTDGITTYSAAASASASSITVGTSLGNAADESFAGEIILWNLQSAVNRKQVTSIGVGVTATGILAHYVSTGMNDTTSVANAVRVLFSSGNIASGTVALYGIR